ncbi:hypothetical protein ACLKA6_006664 [Drosophila palustris]
MWMSVTLLIILATDVNWTLGLRIVPCTGTVYTDCSHYCNNNCPERGLDCVYHCENGCGCSKSLIIRNNGGCHQLMKCMFDDETDEEPDPIPTPCTNTVKETQNANGDKRILSDCKNETGGNVAYAQRGILNAPPCSAFRTP